MLQVVEVAAQALQLMLYLAGCLFVGWVCFKFIKAICGKDR